MHNDAEPVKQGNEVGAWVGRQQYRAGLALDVARVVVQMPDGEPDVMPRRGALASTSAPPEASKTSV